MNIGLMNIRITIQKNELTTDEIGNQLNSWKDYFSCATTAVGAADGVHVTSSLLRTTMVSSNR